MLKCGQIRQYHDEYGHFLSSKIIFSKEKHRPTVKNANCQFCSSLIKFGFFCRIVLVEEAAEILEPCLISAVSRDTDHLIMIGDHKQLRPNVDTYKLRINCHFDVSMMERLIKWGIRSVLSQCFCYHSHILSKFGHFNRFRQLLSKDPVCLNLAFS